MNQHNEKVIKEALALRRTQKDAEFLKEIEEAKSNPALKVTEPEIERLTKEKGKKKNYKPLLRVASIILVIAASITAVTFSVEGFNEKIASFFTNLMNKDYTAVDVGENDDLFSTYKGQFCPSVVPKGYVVGSIEYGNDKNIIVLKNNKGNAIFYKEQSGDLKLNLDSEDADEVRDIVINGMEGLYVKKNNVETMVIKADKNMLYLTDNDTQVDLISFAELIEKK